MSKNKNIQIIHNFSFSINSRNKWSGKTESEEIITNVLQHLRDYFKKKKKEEINAIFNTEI